MWDSFRRYLLNLRHAWVGNFAPEESLRILIGEKILARLLSDSMYRVNLQTRGWKVLLGQTLKTKSSGERERRLRATRFSIFDTTFPF